MRTDSATTNGRGRVVMAAAAGVMASMAAGNASADIVVLGIDDIGSRHSQMFQLNVTTGESTLIGPRYNNKDIEALAYMDDSIVGVTGDNNVDHDLVSLDFATGSLATMASMTFDKRKEIEGMASTADGTVWGVIEGVGLAIIGADGSHDLRISTAYGFEGLAAESDGSMLYGADGSKLYSINTGTGSINQIANLGSQINSAEIENLEMMDDGTLAFFWHRSSSTRFSRYDLATGSLDTKDLGNLGLVDIEAFVFAPIPTPGSIVILASFGLIAGRGRRRRIN